jgi:hypothetical protein
VKGETLGKLTSVVSGMTFVQDRVSRHSRDSCQEAGQKERNEKRQGKNGHVSASRDR